jgi:FKBP-type peptidyl-prolyl cis-trans isomerase
MSALKITLLLALTLSLSSCFMDPEKSEPTKTPTTDTIVSTNPVNCTEVTPLDAAGFAVWEAGSLPDGTDDMAGSGDIVYVNYTLRSCTADGEMIDTSREADAMAGGIYMTGRTYEPFSTIIGSHQTVRGFEHGLIGMKKGERKTIIVAPVDGY